MAHNDQLHLIGYFLCVATFLLLVAVNRKRLLYAFLKSSMQKIAARLHKHKGFLFRGTEEHPLKNLEELLELSTHTSLLLKEWKKKKSQDSLYPKLITYVDDCKERTELLLKEPDHSAFSFSQAYKTRRQGFIRGNCYFCSAPTLFPFRKKCRIAFKQQNKKVLSCLDCHSSLKKTHKVGTLFFTEEDKQVHWYQVPDYTPQMKYWELNQKRNFSPQRKQPVVLKLVPRHKTKSSQTNFS